MISKGCSIITRVTHGLSGIGYQLGVRIEATLQN